MKTSLFKIVILVAACGAALATHSNAAYITGVIDFSGGNATWNSSPISAGATTITAFGGTTKATNASGNYAPLLNQTIVFNPFTPGAPGGVVPTPVLATPLWTRTVGLITYSFNMDTITFNSIVGTGITSLRSIQGTGTMFATGFDPTPAQWSYTSAGPGVNAGAGHRRVAFTASFVSPHGVPDGGATVAMLGVTLLGLTGVRRFVK